eukprot:1090819-Rhodomonas_salina.2
MSGTAVAYAATRYPVLPSRILLRNVRYCHSVCCSLPGTAIVYAAVCLRTCYAMSGTDIAYQDRVWTCCRSLDAVCDGVNSAISLRACYAMSGTDIAYAAICLRAS